MENLNVSQLIITTIVIISSLTIHEYAHGLISHLQGDDTPQRYGRLTLNPLAHLDIFGLIALFVFKFGWAKPIPIDSYYYKNRRLGIILTSFAGPASNLLLAFFSALVIYGVKPQSEAVIFFLVNMVLINTGLAVFNMLPFPPLDGSKIFAELFGGRIANMIYSLEGKGMFILFILLWLPPVTSFIGTVRAQVIYSIVDLAQLIVGR